jgi:cytochrome c-type biogenesis protein CcmH/NrfG
MSIARPIRRWELTGKLALAEGNAKAALEAYNRAIALQPGTSTR